MDQFCLLVGYVVVGVASVYAVAWTVVETGTRVIRQICLAKKCYGAFLSALSGDRISEAEAKEIGT